MAFSLFNQMINTISIASLGSSADEIRTQITKPNNSQSRKNVIWSTLLVSLFLMLLARKWPICGRKVWIVDYAGFTDVWKKKRSENEYWKKYEYPNQEAGNLIPSRSGGIEVPHFRPIPWLQHMSHPSPLHPPLPPPPIPVISSPLRGATEPSSPLNSSSLRRELSPQTFSTGFVCH